MPDDTRGMGNRHEKSVEIFQSEEGGRRIFCDMTTLAELEIEQPCGQEMMGTLGLDITGYEEIVDSRGFFPSLDAVNLLPVPWMPRVMNRQKIAVVRSVLYRSGSGEGRGWVTVSATRLCPMIR